MLTFSARHSVIPESGFSNSQPQNRTNMPNKKPKILVLGATGQVGKTVISHLIANDKVEVIAAARSPEKAKDLGAPVVYLDLDKPESIAPALKGIDRAFLATGYTIDMMRQSKDFLNIAKKADVKHIVHLGGCGDNDTRVAHYAWHQFIERYIEWCGFSFTHLRFYRNVLMAGAEPAYMKCVFESYTELTNGTAVKPDEVFDNLPAIIGRKPRTLADFAKKHADKFCYQLTEEIV
jgi:uncharacterized protein YbjT (DUF2867 family)